MTSLTRLGAAPDELTARLVRRLESDALDLPMLPDTASQVLQMCGDDSLDAADLAQTLQNDPSLAGHVLRVANSAAYAPNEEIVSLQQAVGRLGMRTVSDIAIAVALKSRAFQVPGYEGRVRALWAHSAMSGGWAREIARKRRRNVEGAFLSGLLHDVGKPVVLQAAIDLTEELGIRPSPGQLSTWMDGFHAEIGARLVQSWSLPEWMSEVVRFHHRPEEAADGVDPARCACLADLLAHWSATPDDESESAVEACPALASLGIYRDELEEIFGLRGRVIEVSEAFA